MPSQHENGKHRKTDGLTIVSKRSNKHPNLAMNLSLPTATTSEVRMDLQRHEDADVTEKALINTRETGKTKQRTQNKRNKENHDQKISQL